MAAHGGAVGERGEDPGVEFVEGGADDVGVAAAPAARLEQLQRGERAEMENLGVAAGGVELVVEGDRSCAASLGDDVGPGGGQSLLEGCPGPEPTGGSHR